MNANNILININVYSSYVVRCLTRDIDKTLTRAFYCLTLIMLYLILLTVQDIKIQLDKQNPENKIIRSPTKGRSNKRRGCCRKFA
tara:strand:- start:18187 stop:18441 length:255 start_codon:yes stop_codon:yes gene_type:complete